MSEIHNSQAYKRVLEMLNCTVFEDRNFLEQILNPSHEHKRSFKYWLASFLSNLNRNDGESDQRYYYRVIIYAAAEYILGYPAPVSVKQKLFQQMFALCEAVGEQHAVENYESLLKDLPMPVDQDLTIAFVKELHGRDGVTKNELAAEYGVHKKTAQTLIHRIAGESSYQPLRIGGQIVRVPVAHHEEKGRDEERRFYTPNSMSPIVFQLNLMQAATLLQSFYCNYERGNMIPLDMAIDTWCQLSDYTKNRIEEVFCRRDPQFADFIDMVDKEAESGEYRFMTESEMLESRDSNSEEQLMLAFKGGMICDLVLTGPYRTWKRKRIFYDFEKESFYAVSADDIHGDKIYFDEDELLELSETF